MGNKIVKITVTMPINDKEHKALSANKINTTWGWQHPAQMTDYEKYWESKTIEELLKKFIKNKIKGRHDLMSHPGIEWAIYQTSDLDDDTQIGITQSR